MKNKIKKTLTFLAISLVFTGVIFANFAMATDGDTKNNKIPDNTEYIDGGLIVKASSAADIEQYGDVTKVTDNIYIVETPNAETAKDAAESLEENPKVQAILPNIKLKNDSIRSQMFYSWGMAATGSDHYMDWLNYIQDKGTSPKNTVVAVLDSGIWKDHEVFFDKSGNSRLCSDGLEDYAKWYYREGNSIVVSDNIEDIDGHGTNTAGIIAQSTTDNVCILPVKVTENGEGDLISVVDALMDVSAVANVVNMSIGTSDSVISAEQKDIFNDLISSIIRLHPSTLIASAGNNHESTVGFPSSLNQIISVSALKKSGNKYTFDNSYSNYGSGVDFSMPGTSIIAPASQLAPGSYYYEAVSGTSFSAPHLSAAAALLLSDPEYSYASTTDFANQNDVYNGLKANATYLGTSSTKRDNYYGNGMVDFGENMFTPGRASATVTLSDDHKTATISGFALGADQIKSYAVTDMDVAPSNWTNVSSTPYGSSYVVENLNATVFEDGTYYLWIKDRNDKVSRTPVEVNGVEAEQFIPDGIYNVHSTLNQNRVVDVSGGSDDNRANIQIWDGNSTVAQKFIFRHLENNIYQVENLKSGKALTVANSGTGNGTNVQQENPNSSCSQKWRAKKTIDGYISLVSTCGNRYLDIAGGNSQNGANLQIWDGNGTMAQKFVLKAFQEAPRERLLTDGTYKISSALSSNKVLDIAGGSHNDSANLQIYSSNGTNAQKFNITYLKDGFYKIANVVSNKVIDVAGAGLSNGTNVQQYSWNSSIAQQWMIVKTSDNYYTFLSRCNGMTLDIAGGSSNDGTNVWLYARNNTNAQKFSLTRL